MSTGQGGANKHRGNNFSLCEQSSLMAANFVKVSSLVLAKMTLSAVAAGGRVAPAKAAPAVVPSPPLKPGGMRFEKLPSAASAKKYVMVPDKGNNSVDEGNKGVDERAAEYILKVRQRNQDDGGAAKEMLKCIPPPPSNKWTSYAS